jgi:hypothetical protein
MVVLVCGPSYAGGISRKDRGLRLALGKKKTLSGKNN